MLDICIYLVFAILLIVCALLLLVVLMQRPKQEGLGAAFGSQMTDMAFGARTTDVLKKGTVLFGTLFMVLSLVLTILVTKKFSGEKSDLATREVPAAQAAGEGGAAASEPEPEIDLNAKLAAPEAQAPVSVDAAVPAESVEKPAESAEKTSPSPEGAQADMPAAN